MKRFILFTLISMVFPCSQTIMTMEEKKVEKITLEDELIVNVAICLNFHDSEIQKAKKGESDGLTETMYNCLVDMSDQSASIVDSSLMSALRLFALYCESQLKKNEKLTEMQLKWLNAIKACSYFSDEYNEFYIIKKTKDLNLNMLGFCGKACKQVFYGDEKLEEILPQKIEGGLTLTKKVPVLLSLFDKNFKGKRNFLIAGHSKQNFVGNIDLKRTQKVPLYLGCVSGLDCSGYRALLTGLNDLQALSLYAISCNLGGSNLVPFHHKLSLNYPVFIGSTNDWEVQGGKGVSQYFKGLCSYISKNGDKSFDSMNSSLSTIISQVVPFRTNDFVKINHLPLIWLPSDSWFKVIDDEEIEVIRDEDQKDIVFEESEDKKALLIYPHEVTATITLKGNARPRLVSMISGPAYHNLSKIVASDRSFDQLLAILASDCISWKKDKDNKCHPSYYEKIYSSKAYFIRQIISSDVIADNVLFYTQHGKSPDVFAIYQDNKTGNWYGGQGKNPHLFRGFKWQEIDSSRSQSIKEEALELTQFQQNALNPHIINDDKKDTLELDEGDNFLVSQSSKWPDWLNVLNHYENNDLTNWDDAQEMIPLKLSQIQHKLFTAIEQSNVKSLTILLSQVEKKFMVPELGAQLLRKAIEAHGEEYEMVKLLLQHIPEDSLGEYAGSMTPLCASLNLKKYAIAKLLLNNGAKVSVNDAHTDGLTPLFFAAMHNSYEMVKLLLDNGAQGCDEPCCASGKDVTGTTPLWWAVGHKNEEMFKLMLPLSNYDALYYPGQKGLSAVELMVRRGSNILVTLLSLLDQKNLDEKLTELHSHIAFHILSLQDSNMMDLIFKCYQVCFKLAKIKNEKLSVLIDELKEMVTVKKEINKCRENKQDYEKDLFNENLEKLKKTTLNRLMLENKSAKNGASKIIETLKKENKEEQVKLINECGEFLLKYSIGITAESQDKVELMHYLLDNGAHGFLNSSKKVSATPLFLAVRSNNYELTELLLHYDKEQKTKNRYELGYGITPLVWAISINQNKIIELLLKNDVSESFLIRTFDRKLTPLCFAAFKNYYDLVELLLKYGASNSIHIPDIDGYTPMDWAVYHNNSKMIDLLKIEYEKYDQSKKLFYLDSGETNDNKTNNKRKNNEVLNQDDESNKNLKKKKEN